MASGICMLLTMIRGCDFLTWCRDRGISLHGLLQVDLSVKTFNPIFEGFVHRIQEPFAMHRSVSNGKRDHAAV